MNVHLVRSRLALPPWPTDVAGIRDQAFPSWYLGKGAGPQESWLLTAGVGNRLIGYAQAAAGIEATNCYLRELAVAEDHRHEGIGRRLVYESARWLGENGFEVVFLDALEDGQEALRMAWFESLGFTASHPSMHCARIDLLLAAAASGLRDQTAGPPG